MHIFLQAPASQPSAMLMRLPSIPPCLHYPAASSRCSRRSNVPSFRHSAMTHSCHAFPLSPIIPLCSHDDDDDVLPPLSTHMSLGLDPLPTVLCYVNRLIAFKWLDDYLKWQCYLTFDPPYLILVTYAVKSGSTCLI
jgi:hypothetical protein